MFYCIIAVTLQQFSKSTMQCAVLNCKTHFQYYTGIIFEHGIAMGKLQEITVWGQMTNHEI